jgi:transposase
VDITTMGITTVVGIDAHSQIHAAASVDIHDRSLQLLTVGAASSELARLVAWTQQQPEPRLVAVEGAKGYGRALTQALLAAGETVVDVASHLTWDSRRRSRRRGKDDEGDAIAIAIAIGRCRSA